MKHMTFIILVLLCYLIFFSNVSAKTIRSENDHLGQAADFAFVLDIYGNADMNCVIDTADLDYVNAVIEGRAQPTKYADADDNGVIDQKDLSYIETLINGTCKSLTLIDSSRTKVKINLPVTRVVSMAPWATRTLVQLNAQDTLVGMDAYTTTKGSKYAGQFAFIKASPRLMSLTNIGTDIEPNKEVLASLHADMILAGRIKPDQAEVLKKTSGCPVLFQPRDNMTGVDYAIDNGPYENWLSMGYVFGKRKRAREIISFCEQEFEEIRARTSTLSGKEKRTAWYCSGKINRGSRAYSPILISGARMPSANGEQFFGEIQLEQVLKWNPDVIFVQYWPHLSGMIDDIRKDKTLSLLNAVKNNEIVFLRNGRLGPDSAFNAAETWYIAKNVYPERFGDINVEERANKVLEFLYGTPGLYTWEITERPVFKTW